MANFLLSIFSFLGSPALIKELRARIDFLERKLVEAEAEKLKLQDSVLERQGYRPLNPEPLPPATERFDATPFDEWQRQDIEREIGELQLLAADDPDVGTPLLENALIKYRDVLKLNG